MQSIKLLSESNENIRTLNDTPVPWGLFFQDTATPQMEGLEELHNNIFFYLLLILFILNFIVAYFKFYFLSIIKLIHSITQYHLHQSTIIILL